MYKSSWIFAFASLAASVPAHAAPSSFTIEGHRLKGNHGLSLKTLTFDTEIGPDFTARGARFTVQGSRLYLRKLLSGRKIYIGEIDSWSWQDALAEPAGKWTSVTGTTSPDLELGKAHAFIPWLGCEMHFDLLRGTHWFTSSWTYFVRIRDQKTGTSAELSATTEEDSPTLSKCLGSYFEAPPAVELP